LGAGFPAKGWTLICLLLPPSWLAHTAEQTQSKLFPPCAPDTLIYIRPGKPGASCVIYLT